MEPVSSTDGGKEAGRLDRRAARTALRALMASRPGVRVLNALHRRAPLALKRRLFYLGGFEACRIDASWRVDFAGRRLLLPLRRGVRLAWCAALGFHGYDPELHAFYEALVRSRQRPRVFFDVGAHYGLHGLRFLAAGVRAVAFEPNAACHGYFQDACALNGFRGELHAVAVAQRSGSAELAVPGDDTYLATIVPAVRQRWADRADLAILRVPQISLDDFIGERGLVPDVIKVDAEGSEVSVLRGAARLLDGGQVLVVFESWPSARDRGELFAVLRGAGYGVQGLALPFQEAPDLSVAEFERSPAGNFLARPRGFRLERS